MLTVYVVFSFLYRIITTERVSIQPKAGFHIQIPCPKIGEVGLL